ncbi:MAG: hypothetical protein PF541_17075 [Prolixibacteraceae bacterium]|nr:hypothetical protein [Prolixibacteraceae bacterium]
MGDINVRIFEAFSNEKAIVTAVQPTELLEGMNNQNKHIANSNPNNEDWKKRLSNVKFDDNPILVIIRPDE